MLNTHPKVPPHWMLKPQSVIDSKLNTGRNRNRDCDDLPRQFHPTANPESVIGDTNPEHEQGSDQEPGNRHTKRPNALGKRIVKNIPNGKGKEGRQNNEWPPRKRDDVPLCSLRRPSG